MQELLDRAQVNNGARTREPKLITTASFIFSRKPNGRQSSIFFSYSIPFFSYFVNVVVSSPLPLRSPCVSRRVCCSPPLLALLRLFNI